MLAVVGLLVEAHERLDSGVEAFTVKNSYCEQLAQYILG